MSSDLKRTLNLLSKDELKDILNYVSNLINNSEECSTYSIEYVDLGLDLDGIRNYLSNKSIKYLFDDHIELSKINDIDIQNLPLIVVINDRNNDFELILRLDDRNIAFNISKYFYNIFDGYTETLKPYNEYIIDDTNENEIHRGYSVNIDCPYCESSITVKYLRWTGDDHLDEYCDNERCDECGLIYTKADNEEAINIPQFVLKLIRDGYYRIVDNNIILPSSLRNKILLENFKNNSKKS
jgi:hypothetical protein